MIAKPHYHGIEERVSSDGSLHRSVKAGGATYRAGWRNGLNTTQYTTESCFNVQMQGVRYPAVTGHWDRCQLTILTPVYHGLTSHHSLPYTPTEEPLP